MGKHLDAIKPLEEFRAPWETEAGDETEVDKPKLKRFIYNLIKDKAKAQDAREDASEALDAAEKERDEAKEEASKASPEEANKKIAKLEAENSKLKDENKQLVEDKEYGELRAEVLEGLEAKYAKYVTGKTREELEKSLESVRADFGLDEDRDPDDDDGDDGPSIRTRPRAKLTNGGDPDTGKPGEKEIDFDAIADAAITGGRIFG